MFTKRQLTNLKKVRAFIAKLEPSKLKMRHWVSHRGIGVQNDIQSTKGFTPKHFQQVGCGTAGCIAGWGAVAMGCLGAALKKRTFGSLAYYDFNPDYVGKKLGIRAVAVSGGNVFTGIWPTAIVEKYGLERQQGNNLYIALGAFDKLGHAKRKAAILDVLDYLIATGREPRQERILADELGGTRAVVI